MGTTFLDRLRAPFAWKTSHCSRVWHYSENSVTGQRRAVRCTNGHQPLDFEFLRVGDKVIANGSVCIVAPTVRRQWPPDLACVSEAPTPPTGGSGVRFLEPGETAPPTCTHDGPYYGTDNKTLADCRMRFDNIRNFQQSPTLYRTAGKQILEGTEHYADARDEVAAAVITKALNGGMR